MKKFFKEHSFTLILLAPWLVTFALFWGYPLVSSLLLSFSKYSTLRNESEWIGLTNYIALARDAVFEKAIVNTAIFVFGTIPLTTICAMALAVALNRNLRLKAFYRTMTFLPSVTSIVVLALVFKNLYSSDSYITMLCKLAGLPHPELGWLLEPLTALAAVMAMDVWISIGYYAVLFLAALQTIPNDWYENASLLGATAWQQFWRITLPALRPTLLFVLVINTIKSFQVFVEIYVMTQGGPLGSTSTIIYEVYTHAFERSDGMGYASAMAYVVFAIIIVFSLLQMRLLRTRHT